MTRAYAIGLSTLSLALVAGLIQPSLAQQSSPALAAEPGTPGVGPRMRVASGGAPVAAAEPENIVVTATKRRQNLRQVAISMSAITGAQLAKANANSLADYITRVPGVVFNDYQPGISEVVIRGIASTTYHEQGQTTTGYYINEVQVVEPGFPIAIPDVDTFDLNRVEVLRGPQGTLFGSSTLGGLVNYIVNTADTTKYDAAAEGLIGGTQGSNGNPNYAGKFMINVPIIKDELAVRFTAGQRYDAGYLNNLGTGKLGANNFRTRDLRGSVVFTPTADTKITYLTAYQDTELQDQTYVDLQDNDLRNTPRAEPQTTSFFLNSLRLDQTTPYGTFTVIGSNDEKFNTTVFTYPYFYVTGDTTGDAAAYDRGIARANIKTIEARFASTQEGPFHWLLGTSYLHATKESVDHIYQQGAANFIDTHEDEFGGIPGTVLAPDDSIYGYTSNTSNDDFGVFGELSYKPIRQVEITVGGRYYDTKDTGTIINAAGSLGPGSYSATSSTFSEVQKDAGFTPKVNLAYRPDDNLTAYFTYAKGFRVGGPNPNAAILAGIPKAFGSDTVSSYEVGAKTSLFDHRLAIDADVFHLDWDNIQARLFTSAPYYYSYVTNAGGARVNGVEFAGTAHITSQLTFSSSVTWQDAQLTKFLPDTFAAGGGHPAGSTLPGSSHWMAANTMTLDLYDLKYDPTFEIAHRYESAAPVAFNSPVQRGNFHIFDVRISMNLTPKVRLLAFANNILDRSGVLDEPFPPQGSITRPRTYGLRIDWSL